MMVAGEASGDLLGAELLTDLKDRFPRLEAIGVGGARMRRAGLCGAFDVNDLSVIGLAEVLRRLPRLATVFRHLTDLLRNRRPDLLITVDLPDFNFLLAGRARKLGIPVVHYVGPQVWAWRRGRVHRIARLIDHLLVLFPFEPELYVQTGLPVTFVGHPLVAALSKKRDREAIRREVGITDGQKMVVLLPGSRHGEMERLLPVMASACHRLRERLPETRFVLALADTLSPEAVADHWPVDQPRDLARVIQGRTHDLVAAADAALVASGTATLETALLETPMVVVYRVNPLTYRIGRKLVKVPFIALPNLVAGRKIVPERIQEQAEPGALAEDLFGLLTRPESAEAMREAFRSVKRRLSPAGVSASDVVAGLLGGRRGGGGEENA